MQTATDFALTKENLGAYLTGSLSGDSAKGIEAMLSKLKREDVSKQPSMLAPEHAVLS